MSRHMGGGEYGTMSPNITWKKKGPNKLCQKRKVLRFI
jgi:hypothetical protein